ncbi:MAG TPA: hypothetical protein VFZ53_11435 [Polyangiaceae bacterium]
MRQTYGVKQGKRLVPLLFAALAVSPPVAAQAPAATAPAPLPAPIPTPPSEHEMRESCLANHEQAQLRRIEQRLVGARAAARACAVTACPAAIRSDCSEWVGELSKLIPTVLLIAESGRGELENVRVTLDGMLLTEKLDGTAMEIEPGPHLLRFEHGSEPPIERRIDVPEGEKGFMVRVRFAGEAPPAVPVAPVAPATAPPPVAPRDPGTRPVPVLTYVFGGVAIAAAGTSAVLAANAFSEKSKATEECAPNCDEARIDDIHGRFVAADIAGGAAVAAAGLAVLFYVTRPTVPSADQQARFAPFLGLRPRRSGVELSAGSAF